MSPVTSAGRDHHVVIRPVVPRIGLSGRAHGVQQHGKLASQITRRWQLEIDLRVEQHLGHGRMIAFGQDLIFGLLRCQIACSPASSANFCSAGKIPTTTTASGGMSASFTLESVPAADSGTTPATHIPPGFANHPPADDLCTACTCSGLLRGILRRLNRFSDLVAHLRSHRKRSVSSASKPQVLIAVRTVNRVSLVSRETAWGSAPDMPGPTAPARPLRVNLVTGNSGDASGGCGLRVCRKFKGLCAGGQTKELHVSY